MKITSRHPPSPKIRRKNQNHRVSEPACADCSTCTSKCKLLVSVNTDFKKTDFTEIYVYYYYSVLVKDQLGLA